MDDARLKMRHFAQTRIVDSLIFLSVTFSNDRLMLRTWQSNVGNMH
jgi:hypothetical protein